MESNQEGDQEDEQDDVEGKEKKRNLPCRNVVNFYFTNFPTEWNKANLRNLFAEVGEICDVYVARKVSKRSEIFRFARFFRVGNVHALENRLNRVEIEKFKLRANVAKFERLFSHSKQGCRKLTFLQNILHR